MNKSFQEVHSLLLLQNRIVTYKSLTSDMTHSVHCTIPKAIQSNSDKVLVWDLGRDQWTDIEVNTIESIT